VDGNKTDIEEVGYEGVHGIWPV